MEIVRPNACSYAMVGCVLESCPFCIICAGLWVGAARVMVTGDEATSDAEGEEGRDMNFGLDGSV